MLSVSEEAQYGRNAWSIRIDERPRAFNDLKFDGTAIYIPTNLYGKFRSVHVPLASCHMLH